MAVAMKIMAVQCLLALAWADYGTSLAEEAPARAQGFAFDGGGDVRLR
jgi:hypothetical protein